MSNECNFKKNIDACDIFNEYEKLKPLQKLSIAVEIFKYKWGKYTFIVLFVSLGLIFILGVISNLIDIKIIVNEQNKKLLCIKGFFEMFDLMQLWVSLGLGIVAMIFSIISMFLSFYNLELQKEGEKENKDQLLKLTGNIVENVRGEVKENLKVIKEEMNGHFQKIESSIMDIRNKVYNSNKDITGEEPKEAENSELSEFIEQDVEK